MRTANGPQECRPVWRLWLAISLVGAALLAAAPSFATVININWLDMSPTPFNTAVPNNSVYFVPGVGNVTVSYSLPGDWTQLRSQSPPNIAGNVVSGPDTYSWTNYEYFGTIFTAGDLGPVVGTITYTFPGTLPAGSVFVGALGLGATTSFGGGTSTTRVLQNGTFLGDWVPGAGYGPTQFTGGAGFFTMQNSLTGPGGIDPWWNTYLGVARVDDAVSSITVYQTALRGDGIGVNVGFLAPGTVSVEHSSWSGIKGLFR